jgi:hypothetical protein
MHFHQFKLKKLKIRKFNSIIHNNKIIICILTIQIRKLQILLQIITIIIQVWFNNSNLNLIRTNNLFNNNSSSKIINLPIIIIFLCQTQNLIQLEVFKISFILVVKPIIVIKLLLLQAMKIFHRFQLQTNIKVHLITNNNNNSLCTKIMLFEILFRQPIPKTINKLEELNNNSHNHNFPEWWEIIPTTLIMLYLTLWWCKIMVCLVNKLYISYNYNNSKCNNNTLI